MAWDLTTPDRHPSESGVPPCSFWLTVLLCGDLVIPLAPGFNRRAVYEVRRPDVSRVRTDDAKESLCAGYHGCERRPPEEGVRIDCRAASPHALAPTEVCSLETQLQAEL